MAKIDVKRTLLAVDRKDRSYFNNLDEQERKALVGFYYMLQRYVSSSQGMAAHHIFFTNLFVNRGHLTDTGIPRHPELVWLSFCAVGTGSKQYHPYIKPPGAKARKNRVQEFVSECYPTWKQADIELFCKINSQHDLKNLAQNHGLDDAQIKEIFGK